MLFIGDEKYHFNVLPVYNPKPKGSQDTESDDEFTDTEEGEGDNASPISNEIGSSQSKDSKGIVEYLIYRVSQEKSYRRLTTTRYQT